MNLNRELKQSVQKIASVLRRGTNMVIFPEGTRSKRPGWKSGFYRIALGANVPVYPGFLDFGSRRIGIGERIDLTGDEETDLEMIRAAYAGVTGRHPDKVSPIRF